MCSRLHFVDLILGSIHTNAFSKSPAHQKLRIHTIVFAAFSPSTLKTLEYVNIHYKIRYNSHLRIRQIDANRLDRSSCDVNNVSVFKSPDPFSLFTLIPQGSVFKCLHSYVNPLSELRILPNFLSCLHQAKTLV